MIDSVNTVEVTRGASLLRIGKHGTSQKSQLRSSIPYRIIYEFMGKEVWKHVAYMLDDVMVPIYSVKTDWEFRIYHQGIAAAIDDQFRDLMVANITAAHYHGTVVEPQPYTNPYHERRIISVLDALELQYGFEDIHEHTLTDIERLGTTMTASSRDVDTLCEYLADIEDPSDRVEELGAFTVASDNITDLELAFIRAAHMIGGVTQYTHMLQSLTFIENRQQLLLGHTEAVESLYMRRNAAVDLTISMEVYYLLEEMVLTPDASLGQDVCARIRIEDGMITELKGVVTGVTVGTYLDESDPISVYGLSNQVISVEIVKDWRDIVVVSVIVEGRKAPVIAALTGPQIIHLSRTYTSG